jgi:hypothetical protein
VRYRIIITLPRVLICLTSRMLRVITARNNHMHTL